VRYPIVKLALHESVAIARDVEEHGLRKGDVAVLVDYVPHPEGGQDGCVMEVFNALGESLKVVVLKESDVVPLRADEVLSARRLAPT
jgi:hypothetical protein